MKQRLSLIYVLIIFIMASRIPSFASEKKKIEKKELDPNHALLKMNSGTWFEAPKSKMDAVAYKWPKGITFSVNGGSIKAIMANWSGAAFDTKRNRLLIWGGGHMAYAGNEIYGFDVNDLQWSRLSEPSLKVDRSSEMEKKGMYSDRTPRSNHSYNSIQYSELEDTLCSFGTSAQYPSGQSVSRSLWAYDFKINTWKQKGNCPAMGVGAYCLVLI